MSNSGMGGGCGKMALLVEQNCPFEKYIAAKCSF